MTVLNSFGDTVENHKALNAYTLQDTDAKLKQLSERIDGFDEEFQGYQFKTKTAISLIDTKQAKTVDVIRQQELNLHKKFDQKIINLENQHSQLSANFSKCKATLAEQALQIVNDNSV